MKKASGPTGLTAWFKSHIWSVAALILAALLFAGFRFFQSLPPIGGPLYRIALMLQFQGKESGYFSFILNNQYF